MPNSRVAVSLLLPLIGMLGQSLAVAETVETFNIVHEHGESYAVHYRDELVMNGSGDAVALFHKTRDKIQGDYIWFQQDGKPYVIQDFLLVRRAADLVQMQRKTGARQTELGESQTNLGKEQTHQAEASKSGGSDSLAELVALRAQLKRLQAREDQQAAQPEIADLQARIQQVEKRITEPVSDPRQAQLADEQSKQGDKQAEAGDKQERLARQIAPEMNALIKEAKRKQQTRRLD